MLSKTDIARITEVLKPIPDLACAYLHGSALTPFFQSHSDVDIALLFIPGAQPDLVDIIRTYHSQIHDSVSHAPHFSILSSKNVVFAKQVITKGKCIICHTPYICKNFTMHTFSMYTELNSERKKILGLYTAR